MRPHGTIFRSLDPTSCPTFILVGILYWLVLYIGWHSLLVGILYWLAFGVLGSLRVNGTGGVTISGAFPQAFFDFQEKMVAHSSLNPKSGGHLTVKGRWACVFHFDYLNNYRAVGVIVGVKHDTVKKLAFCIEQALKIEKYNTVFGLPTPALTLLTSPEKLRSHFFSQREL